MNRFHITYPLSRGWGCDFRVSGAICNCQTPEVIPYRTVLLLSQWVPSGAMRTPGAASAIVRLPNGGVASWHQTAGKEIQNHRTRSPQVRNAKRSPKCDDVMKMTPEKVKIPDRIVFSTTCRLLYNAAKRCQALIYIRQVQSCKRSAQEDHFYPSAKSRL